MINLVSKFLKKYFKSKPKRNKLKEKSLNKKPSLSNFKSVGIDISKMLDVKKSDKIVHLSSLPQNFVSLAGGLSPGQYHVKFSEKAIENVQSGTWKFVGKRAMVANSNSSQIVEHGKIVSPVLANAPLIFYHVGSIAFSVYHLKNIMGKLKSIDKKIDKVKAFQNDQRSSKVQGSLNEIQTIGRGILDFADKGKFDQILGRIKEIRSVRRRNEGNFLHLLTDLKKKAKDLKEIESEEWIGSEEGCETLVQTVISDSLYFQDFVKSLYINILSVQMEISFSKFSDYSEVEILNRIKDQKKYLKDFQNLLGQYERNLHNKKRDLIKSLFEFDKTLKARKRKVARVWSQVDKFSEDFSKKCHNNLVNMRKCLRDKKKDFVLVVDKNKNRLKKAA